MFGNYVIQVRGSGIGFNALTGRYLFVKRAGLYDTSLEKKFTLQYSQKFFEHGTDEQRQALTDQIRGNVLRLALQM